MRTEIQTRDIFISERIKLFFPDKLSVRAKENLPQRQKTMPRVSNYL
jgi:hypothetical protein